MSTVYILDMLFVNTIEKRLGRKLTEEELDQARYDEESLELYFIGGRREYVKVPKLVFPDDVMSTHARIDLEFSLRDDVSRSSDEVTYMKWYNDERENTMESLAKTHSTMSGKVR